MRPAMGWALVTSLLMIVFLNASESRAAESAQTVASYAAAFTVSATDADFEDGVRLLWTGTPPEGYVFHVRRDGALISLAASTDTTFYDFSGVPGVEYEYCVDVLESGTETILVSECDLGSRIIFAPRSLESSDGTHSDGIRLSWSDRSLVESGFRITRKIADGGSFVDLGSTEANVEVFVDATADSGVVYQYCIAAFDESDAESDPICDTGFRGFVQPPASLLASDGQFVDRVTLSWTDASIDEVEFRVYRDGTEIAVLPANSESYEDFGALGVAHDYCVAAVRSIPDPPFTVESILTCDSGVGGESMLAAPVALVASLDEFDDRVALAWEDPGETEDGFTVFRDAVLVAELDAGTTSFDDLDAVPGTTHDYCVVATSESGGSSVSECVTGSRAHVLAPSLVNAADGNAESKVEIVWESNSTTVVLFEVLRDGTGIKTLSGTARSYEDRDVDAGVEHDYCVRAYTALGEISETICDLGSRTILAPGAVAASDEGYEDRVLVTWEDHSSVETGYEVSRKEVGAGGDPTSVATRGPNRKSYIDEAGVPGVEYEYSVVAFDSLGTSAAVSDLGMRSLVAPTAVEAGDGTFEDRIEIQWEDRSFAESGFAIYRDGVLIDSTGTNVSSYVDFGIGFGVDHFYEVSAFDSYGESVPGSDTGTTTIEPPGSLRASDSYRDRVVLVWSDESEIESSYVIFRDGQLLGSAPANATSFVDTSALPNTSHNYCMTSEAGSAVSESACANGIRQAPGAGNSLEVGSYLEEIPSQHYGSSVDVDGETAVIGDRSLPVGPQGSYGTVYVYERNAETRLWERTAQLIPPSVTGDFGGSVALSGDWLLVGAPEDPQGNDFTFGSVFAYLKVADTWVLQQEFRSTSTVSSKHFGQSLDLDGETAIVGNAYSSSASIQDATIFELVGSQWVETTSLRSLFDWSESDGFGGQVALDGDRALVSDQNGPGSGPVSGRAHVFSRASGAWLHEATLVPHAGVSWFSLSVDIRGDVALLGYRETVAGWPVGGAAAFRRFGNQWLLEATLIDSGTRQAGFANSLVLGESAALISSSGSPGSAEVLYAYSYDETGRWDERFMFTPEDGGAQNDWYSSQLAFDEETVILGVTQPGRAYTIDLGVRAPGQVAATDDTADGPVRVSWVDRADREEEYRVYRNGELLGTLDSNVESYNDYRARPGEIYDYCVIAYDGEALLGESSPACDEGRRPPDGNITGRIATRFGAGVDSVTICLDPLPNHSLIFDGDGARVRIREAALPADELTMEFWMRSSNPASGATPVSYATDNEPNTLTIHDDSDFTIDVNGVSTGSTGVSANDGDWHHLAMTWRSGDGRVQLFKDGTLAYEVDGIATGTTLPSGGTILFGQEQDVPGGGLDPAEAYLGQLDEFRVWSRVRTAEELSDGRTQVLFSDEEQIDIFARWNFDQGSGGIIQDLGPSDYYGELLGGVHWAPGADPLEVCVTSDLEGNYALANLRYANSNTMRVTPVREGHVFEPAYKTITLSTLDPVENEVAFVDVTTFSVTGLIRYENTFCFAENMEIYVDGALAAATDAEGKFAVSLSPGPHVIEPRKDGHTFDPPSYSLQIDRNFSGKDFINTTRHELIGKVGGGCDLPIGRVQLSVMNECFDETMIETDRDFSFGLPPGKYFIRVLDVLDPPELLDRADILAFFENIGPQEVDLTEGGVVQDFLYRAPLKVAIEGLPEIVCPTIIDTSRNVSIPGVPILQQLQSADLTLHVFEDYGNGNVCPVDSAVVSVFDEVMDQENQAQVASLTDGQITYRTIANTPNIFFGRVDAQGNDRSYQKPVTFVVEVPGREPIAHTEWFFVTGDRPRTGTFVSALSQEIPLLILRDPPGDGSFSEVERGLSTSFSFSDMFTETVESGFKAEIKAGIQFEKGGILWSTNTDVDATTDFGVKFGIEGVQEHRIESRVSLTETLSTSSDELFVGEDADVILGMALNLVFAKSDVLSVDPVTCILTRSDTVRVGGAQEHFGSTYLYTRNHIENVIIPQLQDLRALVPEQAAFYTASIKNWKNQLTLADRLRDEAFASPGGQYPFGYWPPAETRSFSAGADRSFGLAKGGTDTDTYSVEVYTENENSILMGFESAGAGAATSFVINLGFHYKHEVSTSVENEFAVSYTLSDNDTGDYLATDVAYDRRYGTPVFRPRDGRTSCPWEAGTQPRDSTIIAIEPPVLHDVDPSGPGVFTLSLTNASPSEEGREYVLLPIQTSNPGGAIVKANGEAFGGGLPFFIEPDRTQEVTLTVERGPTRFFYDEIQLQLVSPCEFERWQAGGPLLLADTLSFSIDYAAPCSDIVLFEPRSGWKFNLDDSISEEDTVRVTLDDFVLQLSEEDQIETVGAQFRKIDTDVWFPIATVERDSIPTFPDGQPKSVGMSWDVSALNDGSYELRAFTECQVGKAFSLSATGRIDRIAPRPFGTPQPTDAVLAFGDEIAITFNEKIRCQSVNDVSVRLEYADTDSTTAPMLVDLNCDGRTILITPLAPPLETLEGKQVTAVVFGIQDLAGNVMESSTGGSVESWSFEVMRSAVAWTDSDIIHRGAFRNPGEFTASLVNGLGLETSFQLANVPEWLSPSSTDGTILSTDIVEITFDIADTLSLGFHEATLDAVFTDPPAVLPLSIRVELDCQPPIWSLDPGNYENSMTLVVQASLGGAISQDPDDVVAAFVGTEIRGLGQPVYVPELDDWMTFLTVHSNRIAGESVRFRIFDSSECLVYGNTDKSFRFESDSRIGEPVAPKLLIGLDEVPVADQLVDLNEGWTWFSVNLSNVDMSLDYALGDLNPRSGDLIKSQTQFSQYDEQFGWLGSLEQLDYRQSYLIKLSEAGTIVVSGDPVAPGENPILVANGWNWVGYLPQNALSVDEALGQLVPTNGDEMLVRSQFEFAQHLEESGVWSGSLSEMAPGVGYRLYLDNAFASDNKLEYPDEGLLAALGYGEATGRSRSSAGASGHVSPSPTDLAQVCPGSTTFDPRRFEHAMTLTGTLRTKSDRVSSTSLVAAYVGEELRGLATVQEIPSAGRSLLFLMIYSNVYEGETVTLRAFDPETGQHYTIDDSIPFTADEVLGNISDPVVLGANAVDANGGPVAFSFAREFANPVRALDPVTFGFSLPTSERVVFRVFDIQGREVMTLMDEVLPAGHHQSEMETRSLRSGVYLYQLQAGKHRRTEKLVVLR